MEAKMIRQRARENLAGNWGLSIGVAAVAALLGGLLDGASFLPDVSSEYSLPILQNMAQALDRQMQLGTVSLRFRTAVFGLAAFILGGVLELGYARFLLNQHDGKEAKFEDLFSQFDRFGDGFAQDFLRTLYTSLWSLLFIIPGIIKAYGYAMTPFILAEHPDMTASEAIRASTEMMDGHKTDLFILDLSFFGWALLCGLTANLGYLGLNPYTNAARAAFYRQLQAEERCAIYE